MFPDDSVVGWPVMATHEGDWVALDWLLSLWGEALRNGNAPARASS